MPAAWVAAAKKAGHALHTMLQCARKGWGKHEFQTGRAVRQNLHCHTDGCRRVRGPGAGSQKCFFCAPPLWGSLPCVCGDTRGKTREIDRRFPGRIWEKAGWLVGKQDIAPIHVVGLVFARRQGEKGRGRDGTTLERPGQDRTAGASCIVMTHLVSDGRCRNTNRTKRFVALS